MPSEEREITVKLKWSFDEAKVYFVNKGISLQESFIIKDIYLIKEDIDIYKNPNSKVLSKCLIIRESVGKNTTKEIIYKEKIYDDDKNVIKRIRYEVPLVDIDKTYDFFIKIGYKECFKYEQECLSYKEKDKEIVLEYIPEVGLFAKIENNKSIEELINDLNSFKIPYYEHDFNVKKANLMLDKIKRLRR